MWWVVVVGIDVVVCGTVVWAAVVVCGVAGTGAALVVTGAGAVVVGAYVVVGATAAVVTAGLLLCALWCFLWCFFFAGSLVEVVEVVELVVAAWVELELELPPQPEIISAAARIASSARFIAGLPSSLETSVSGYKCSRRRYPTLPATVVIRTRRRV